MGVADQQPWQQPLMPATAAGAAQPCGVQMSAQLNAVPLPWQVLHPDIEQVPAPQLNAGTGAGADHAIAGAVSGSAAGADEAR